MAKQELKQKVRTLNGRVERFYSWDPHDKSLISLSLEGKSRLVRFENYRLFPVNVGYSGAEFFYKVYDKGRIRVARVIPNIEANKRKTEELRELMAEFAREHCEENRLVDQTLAYDDTTNGREEVAQTELAIVRKNLVLSGTVLNVMDSERAWIELNKEGGDLFRTIPIELSRLGKGLDYKGAKFQYNLSDIGSLRRIEISPL